MLMAFSAGAYNSKTEVGTFTLAPGDTAYFPKNFVRVQTLLQANLEFKNFQTFSIGRGTEKTFAARWITVTDTEVITYETALVDKVLEEDATSFGKDGKKVVRERVGKEKERFPHGLNMKGVKSLSITIDTCDIDSNFSIVTNKGRFDSVLKHWWGGGMPFVKNLGDKAFKVELVFERKYADKPIWFMGDSYFNSTSSARWPYHMRMAGYTDWMADHLPGGNAVGLFPCFKHDLDFGTPKIVVWALQSNTKPDPNLNTPEPAWLKTVQEFLSICKEKGITPIFIIPPSGKARARAQWIRNSGYRYIDFAAAIVDHYEEDGTAIWKNPDWLSKDKVHPTKAGAEVMWKAVEAGLPELKKL